MSDGKISLAKIMHLKKEVEPTYQMLTKTYQAELLFMEKKIEKDAYRQNRIESCCWALPFSSNDSDDSKKFAYKNYCKYNPRFCALFKQMTLQERKQYFFQLLNFMKEMRSLYQSYSGRDAFKQDINSKKLRQKIINKLMQKYVKREMLQQLNQKERHPFFEAMVTQQTNANRKVCQLCIYKLYFMDKQNCKQVEKVIDIRNYLILEGQSSKYKNSIYMEAIYEEVKPTKLKLEFILPKDSQTYIPAFREIVQIGKLQKLIANININRIPIKEGKGIENSDVIRHTFMIANEDFSDDEHDHENIISSQNLYHLKKSHKSELTLKKKITLKVQRQQQIKRKLIQTLFYLSEKKQGQNKKINQFLKRQVIMDSRKRSDAIEKLLRRNQNCLIHSPKRQGTQKEILEDLVKDNIEKTDCLHIINNNNCGNQHLTRRLTDSFINNDEDLQPQNGQLSIIKKRRSLKIKYFKNLFFAMYPEYSLSNMFNIRGMEKKILSEQIYNLPQKAIKGKERNPKAQKQIKLKQMQLERLNSICKLFQRKDSPNFIKISLSLKVEVKSLVQALINVQAYPFWHANVTKVTILSVINSDNAINYQIECTDQTGDKYTYNFFMHLFKVGNKYYIFQKSIDFMQDCENQKKNFLDYLYSSKQKINKHRFKFILLRASTSDQNGFTDILIDAQLDQSSNKVSQKVKREDISLLLNFNLIPKYWQLQSCTSLFQNRLNAEWTVLNGQSAHHSEDGDLDFGNTMDRVPLQQLQSPLEIDIMSSEEQVSSSNYYDL